MAPSVTVPVAVLTPSMTPAAALLVALVIAELALSMALWTWGLDWTDIFLGRVTEVGLAPSGFACGGFTGVVFLGKVALVVGLMPFGFAVDAFTGIAFFSGVEVVVAGLEAGVAAFLMLMGVLVAERPFLVPMGVRTGSAELDVAPAGFFTGAAAGVLVSRAVIDGTAFFMEAGGSVFLVPMGVRVGLSSQALQLAWWKRWGGSSWFRLESLLWQAWLLFWTQM